MDPKSWKPGRWALITVALYAATLCAVTWPVIFLTFWKEASNGPNAQVFREPVYLAIIGGLSLLEGLALFFPIGIARQRPVPKRSWVLLAVATGLAFGLLIAGGALSIFEFKGSNDFYDDKALVPVLWWCGAVGAVGWLLWGLFFWIRSRHSDEHSWLRQIRKALLAGSILELLVAVPCHIFVRQRNDCCAGFATFLGIATGVAVMLFAFGPGVFFLFAERVAVLKRAQAPESLATPSRVFEPRGRDTATWTALAAVFLFIPSLVGLVEPAAKTDEFVYITRISFMVLSVAACGSAARAWHVKERLWGVSVLCGCYLLEIAVLIAIGWRHGA